jgi:hypothetical protein
MSERGTVVKLPFAADCCPCVEKLRTVLPLTVGIRAGAVHLVSTLGSVVISARAVGECCQRLLWAHLSTDLPSLSPTSHGRGGEGPRAPAQHGGHRDTTRVGRWAGVAVPFVQPPPLASAPPPPPHAPRAQRTAGAAPASLAARGQNEDHVGARRTQRQSRRCRRRRCALARVGLARQY